MSIHLDNDQSIVELDLDEILAICQTLLSLLNKEEAEVGLLFVNNDEIKLLNNQFRDINKATDVLSFSQIEGDFPEINPNILGDIVISSEKAKVQAEERGISTTEEIVFLIIHGLLHLLGYDHLNSPDEAETMQKKEKELLNIIKEKYLKE